MSAEADIRNLAKWLNEEQTCDIDRQALARVLARLQGYVQTLNDQEAVIHRLQKRYAELEAKVAPPAPAQLDHIEDVLAMVEPKIGCVNHDCDKCKALAEQPAPAQEPCSKCKGLGYYDEGHECDDGSMAGGNYVECEKCKPPPPAQPLADEVLLHKICDAMQPLADHSTKWNGWPGTYKFAQAALSAIKNHVQASPALAGHTKGGAA